MTERILRTAARAGIEDIAQRVLGGERLSHDDGLRLYAADLHAVGALANWRREQLHGDLTYFNVNQHINYTNWCNKFCSFCSFDRLPGQKDAYKLEPKEAAAKIREHLDEPVTEVHMVAGVWPKIPYDYFLDLLRAVKAAKPSIHIKAFTMVEIDQIWKKARQEGRREALADVLADLREAGLGSCPGGGAEIFSDRVHQAGYKNKISGSEWLDLARQVHQAGIRTNCTMLHGHMETLEERVDH
ncbi:MAG: radical SAM protein, partial [Planctomycetota bacterium]